MYPCAPLSPSVNAATMVATSVGMAARAAVRLHMLATWPRIRGVVWQLDDLKEKLQ